MTTETALDGERLFIYVTTEVARGFLVIPVPGDKLTGAVVDKITRGWFRKPVNVISWVVVSTKDPQDWDEWT